MQPSHPSTLLASGSRRCTSHSPKAVSGCLVSRLGSSCLLLLRLPSHEMRSLQVTPSLLSISLDCLARDATIFLCFFSTVYLLLFLFCIYRPVYPFFPPVCPLFRFLFPPDGGCQPLRGSIKTTHYDHCVNAQPKLREAPAARHVSQNSLLPFSAR